jgi:hypothetical protein
MKRILAKIGRFFWSWGFLKFVLWTVTLIALFYVEEDWRGARMWAQTKAKWEAKGESFDFNRLIPPPIPDSQNLGALPLFKLEPEPESGGQPGPHALRQALHQQNASSSSDIPSLGNWQAGHPPDFDKIDHAIAASYEKLFHAAPTTNNPLTQFDAIYPFIAEVNAASATRPYCRFDYDYAYGPPYERQASSLTLQLLVARILAIHADLALSQHRPDLAFTDIETELKLASGENDQPILIAGLVSVVQIVFIEGAIFEGLAQHAWNDAQMARLESDLRRFDFLATYQFAFRGELAGFSIPTLDYLKGGRPNVMNLFFGMSDSSPSPVFYDRNAAYQLWPGGWLEQNKSRITDGLLQVVSLVDPKTHRAFVEPATQEFSRTASMEKSWKAFLPWRVFASLSMSGLLHTSPTFIRSQVWLDQTRLALALERYHLAQGIYPGSLDDLAPAYIAEVPHDVINGEPYRYWPRPDGTFLLYSVGWNEKDEGGLVVTQLPASAGPDARRDEYGDWVWPTLR